MHKLESLSKKIKNNYLHVKLEESQCHTIIIGAPEVNSNIDDNLSMLI